MSLFAVFHCKVIVLFEKENLSVIMHNSLKFLLNCPLIFGQDNTNFNPDMEFEQNNGCFLLNMNNYSIVMGLYIYVK